VSSQTRALQRLCPPVLWRALWSLLPGPKGSFDQLEENLTQEGEVIRRVSWENKRQDPVVTFPG